MAKFCAIFTEEFAEEFHCQPEKHYPVLGASNGDSGQACHPVSFWIVNEKREMVSVNIADCQILPLVA